LHFAARQMYWECNFLFASEDGTIYDPNPTQRLKQSFLIVEHSSQTLGSINFDLDIIKIWCRLIEEYTQRSLTKDTDRLPALAGVVTSFFRKLENLDVEYHIRYSYVAGLWKPTPAHQPLVAGQARRWQTSCILSRTFLVLGSSRRCRSIRHWAVVDRGIDHLRCDSLSLRGRQGRLADRELISAVLEG
jgi:hypothetical protein